MRKQNLYLIAIMALVLAGCKTTGTGIGDRDLSQTFLTNEPIQDTYAYQFYKDSPKGEISKIRYLINLVRYSDLTFFRNNETFSGSVAARWLEYKLNRYAEDCKTVRDFINKTATFSRKSGKDYLIIFPDNSRVPSKYLYLNELRKLENFEAGVTKSTETVELAKEVLENENIVEKVLENEKLTRKVLENENLTRELLENEELAQKVLENEKLVKEILKNEETKETTIEEIEKIEGENLAEISDLVVYGPQLPMEGTVTPLISPLTTIAKKINTGDQIILEEVE